MRLSGAVLLAGVAVSLSGCLPMVAANVADAAVGAAVGRPKDNEGAGGTATDACTMRAQPYGVVHVIDTEQHSPTVIIVWGTVEAAGVRQSFKCVYTTRIASFSVRRIRGAG